MYNLFMEGDPEALFCENDTNTIRLYNYYQPGTFKDGINDFLTSGNTQKLSTQSLRAPRLHLIMI